MTAGVPWWEEAQCKGAPEGDVDAWTGKRPKAAQDRVRGLCVGCPVTDACLADAMRHEGGDAAHRFGMRGGLTPAEREHHAKAGPPRARPVRVTPKPGPITKHGRSAYQKRGCRCDVCREAEHAYQVARRAAR